MSVIKSAISGILSSKQTPSNAS